MKLTIAEQKHLARLSSAHLAEQRAHQRAQDESQEAFRDNLRVGIGQLEGLIERLQHRCSNLQGFLEEDNPQLLGLEMAFLTEDRNTVRDCLEALNKAHAAAEKHQGPSRTEAT